MTRDTTPKNRNTKRQQQRRGASSCVLEIPVRLCWILLVLLLLLGSGAPSFSSAFAPPSHVARPSVLVPGTLFATSSHQSCSESNNRHSRRSRWSRRLKLSLALLLGGARVLPPPPAQASTTTTTTTVADTIVDRYVQQHLFDDESQSAVTSTYRDVYEDATLGRYPSQLSQIYSDSGTDRTTTMAEKNDVGHRLSTLVSWMTSHTALSQNGAVLVLAATFVLAGPLTFLLGGMIVGGISKRNMNRVFVSRYGENYTVDATYKPDDDSVEAPDEDEDEDEDDEDDDDDDDDE